MEPRLVLAVVLAAAMPVAALPFDLAAAPAPAPGPLEPLQAPAASDAAARLAVRLLPRATAAMDADGNKLWDDLDAAYRLATGPGAAEAVVVAFVAGTDPARGLAKAQAAAGPFEVKRTFRIVPGFAGWLTLDQALRVAALPEVRQVERNAPGVPELDTATAYTGADHVVDVLGFDGDRDGNPLAYTRDDVVVAILDTGFHGKHQDLDGGKILHFLDMGNGEAEAYDGGTHGTHVASIAVGTGDADPAYRGVAPGAAMVGIKITSSGGSCTVSTPVGFGLGCQPGGTGNSTLDNAIAGYEFLVDHRDELNIRVSTMSFGFGGNTDGTSALELAVDAAWDAGIVNFKSLGNSGPERGTVTIPGAARGILAMGSMLDPGSQETSFLVPGTEPVASMWGTALSPYSSRGPTLDGRVKPDLTAPGQAVTAALAGTTDEYVAFSGTSMASPHGAGVAALVLDANPALAPDDVRQVLYATAEDWGIQGTDVDYGWGRVQAVEAVAEALRRGGAPPGGVQTPPVPFHEVRTGVLGDSGRPGVSERSIEVEDTTNPFAVTAIVEGRLAGLEVVGPDGGLALSFSSRGALPRQHNAGFKATEAGTHVLRLVGQPGAAWVVDVSHGSAGGVELLLPGLGQGEALQPTAGRPVPGAPWVVVGLAVLGLAVALPSGRRKA